jgi:hypothetical protein
MYLVVLPPFVLEREMPFPGARAKATILNDALRGLEKPAFPRLRSSGKNQLVD